MADQISIGPGRSRLLEQALMQAQQAPSGNWGEAISKIANTGVSAWQLSKEREKEEQQRAGQQETGNQFLKALMGGGGGIGGGGGGGLAAALAANPNIMSHPQAAQYLSLAQSLAPQPAPETFEDVQDPYGRGGVGQRSSLDNRIVGYQQPAATPAVKDRRIVKGPDNLNYYTDTGERVLPGVTMPEPAAEADAPPALKDQLQMVRQLSSDWQKTVQPMQGLLDQSARMKIGYEMAKAGDMLAGSQAILITFNKVLDPTSVVRESEYARSAAGQSALATLEGFADKLAKGGAGVTLEELESYVRFGEEVVQRALEENVGPERERISRLIEFAGVDPALIFTGRFAPEEPAQGLPPSPESAALPQGAPPAVQPAPWRDAAPRGTPWRRASGCPAGPPAQQ